MAVSAFIHTRMQLMAELCVPCVLDLEIHIFRGMATRAFLYLERSFAVMAEAAGLALFHLVHADRLVPPCFVKFGVANPALLACGMYLMTEDDRTRFFYLKCYIRHLVAFIAILDVKGPFSVVTCTAGFSFFHICHGVADIFSDVENRIMAGPAVIPDSFLFDMKIVIEYYLAGIGSLKSHIPDIQSQSGRKNENGA
jgi:hypothetical protein